MQEWTAISVPTLTQFEQGMFDLILSDAETGIEGWNEEELKFKFISFLMRLGHLGDNGKYKTYCEREILATVEDKYLYLKSAFMIAKDILDSPEKPYFYMQEYKKMKDPSGDPVSRLLEGFLIAQYENGDSKPMYGYRQVMGFFCDGRAYLLYIRFL